MNERPADRGVFEGGSGYAVTSGCGVECETMCGVRVLLQADSLWIWRMGCGEASVYGVSG